MPAAMVMPKVAPSPVSAGNVTSPANPSAVMTGDVAADGLEVQGEQFSQLLDDMDARSDGQRQQLARDGRVADAAASTSASALAAQEISDKISQLEAILSQRISPQQARALLQDVNTSLAQRDGNPHEREALEQLQQQLEQILGTGEGRSVADMMAAMELIPQSEHASDHAASPVALRLMSWLQKTLGKHRDVETSSQDAVATDAAASAVTAAMQTLQAGLFRTHDGQNAAQGQEQAGSQGTGIIVRTVPLAASLTVAAPVEQIDASASLGHSMRPGLDTEIASLALSDQNADLPEITLPKLAMPHTASATQALVDDGDGKNIKHIVDASANATATLSIVQRLQDALSQPAAGVSPVNGAEGRAAVTAAAAQSDRTAVAAGVIADAKAAEAQVKSLAAANESPNAGVSSSADTNPVINPSLIGGHSPAHSAGAVQPLAATVARHVVNHAPVTDQVKVAITQAKSDGVERITIQLDPADLGRVEVKMHTGADGQTQVAFLVDKPSTFDALSRDVRSLERSLQDAGIKADAGSMQFNLRQSPQTQLQSGLGEGHRGNSDAFGRDEDEEISASAALTASPVTRHYRVNLHDGIDIRA